MYSLLANCIFAGDELTSEMKWVTGRAGGNTFRVGSAHPHFEVRITNSSTRVKVLDRENSVLKCTLAGDRGRQVGATALKFLKHGYGDRFDEALTKIKAKPYEGRSNGFLMERFHKLANMAAIYEWKIVGKAGNRNPDLEENKKKAELRPSESLVVRLQVPLIRLVPGTVEVPTKCKVSIQIELPDADTDEVFRSRFEQELLYVKESLQKAGVHDEPTKQ